MAKTAGIAYTPGKCKFGYVGRVATIEGLARIELVNAEDRMGPGQYLSYCTWEVLVEPEDNEYRKLCFGQVASLDAAREAAESRLRLYAEDMRRDADKILSALRKEDT